MDIKIILLNDSTIDQQVDLYKSAFNHIEDFECIKKKWIHKHYKNPIHSSFIFGAFCEDRLVGMNAYLPTKFLCNGEHVLCVQSCESAVDPDFQGRGIWSKVVKYALDYLFTQTDCQFVFGFPNYRNSYPGFVKMGWETLLNMNNYILVNNGKNFSKTYDGRFKFIRNILRIGGIQKIIIKLKHNKQLSVLPCSVKEILGNEMKYGSGFVYSEDYLKWRCECKGANTFMVVDDKNQIVATFISSKSHFNGSDITKVEYMAICHDDCKISERIWACVFKYLIENNISHSMIRLWIDPNSIHNSVLKKLGLIKSKHPNPFIIYSKPSFNVVENVSQWNLMFFDLDY